IFSQGFWLVGSLALDPFAFGFLISNSTYRFRPKGAPSREFHAAEIWMSCGLVSRVFLTDASSLARKQSGEVQESLRTSGKSSLLNPVRFGQLTHEPASGTSVSSCLSNGADASCSKMFDSIHTASNAESAVMRTPHHGMLGWRHGMAPLLRIIVGAFSKATSWSVALKRPVRNFGAIAASRVSSFTVGSARV